MDTIIAAETAEAARASLTPPPTYSDATSPLNGATYGSQPQLNGHRKGAPALHPETIQRQTRVMSHLAHRDPVELEFSDLSYTVSVGFRKGRSLEFQFFSTKLPISF